MLNIEQFVKERQEIKPLRTCESYFFTVPKKYAIPVSLYKICLTKIVRVDTRFYLDTDEVLYQNHMLNPLPGEVTIKQTYT